MAEKEPSAARLAALAFDERIYDVTRQIPAGRVGSYGQIALVVGAGSARRVGRAMAVLPTGSDVPWHRVINSQGRISARRDGGPSPEQRRRLRQEGVWLDVRGGVDLAAAAWSGPSWEWLEAQGYDIEELVLRSQRKARQGVWVNWNL